LIVTCAPVAAEALVTPSGFISAIAEISRHNSAIPVIPAPLRRDIGIETNILDIARSLPSKAKPSGN
jgi:hypothetical protein